MSLPATGILSNFQTLDIPCVLGTPPHHSRFLTSPVLFALFHVMCMLDCGSNVLLSMWHFFELKIVCGALQTKSSFFLLRYIHDNMFIRHKSLFPHLAQN